MVKKHIKLDRMNRRILTELQSNARISNNDLSEIIGLSPSACLQRVKSLEDAGFIIGYAMVTNVDKLCVNVKAYAHFTLKSNSYQHCSIFEKGIKKYTEVVDCMKVNGGIDYIAFMMSSSIEDFNSVCNDMMQDTLGIEKITSHFVIDTAKWFGGYPLDTLEWKVQED
ncbi:Lrp/AsnC family transcriptional regulator [Colwellia polaris]|jgi:Lrp/AsnC family leucine-responsive transcriptional regulator|uniref:Lrp/AsnC family transcriptional regulator n=1 Tax=Colwellia polaris TaxID=326537 RepID=UPI000A177D21|nr:Lrp/AsnC family transcriptional regulator [Colwellia polaris]|tara:strand:+ start:2444 stop:2947 length:504 start_codon:yes stop_codon:yes gene_type:complete